MTMMEPVPGASKVETKALASRSASPRSPLVEPGFRASRVFRITADGAKPESTSALPPIPIKAARSLSAKPARIWRASSRTAGHLGFPESMDRMLSDGSMMITTSRRFGWVLPLQPSGR